MAAWQSTLYPWHAQTPHLGSPDEFSDLFRLLLEAGYREEGICRRLNADRLYEYAIPPFEQLIALPVADALDALIRLFFQSTFAEEVAVAGALPSGGLALLRSLRLVASDPARPGMLFGASGILPTSGLLTVCDRGNHAPDGSVGELPPDVVYPAIYDNTHRFLQGLPASRCDAMLDLGTGTGVAALLGARLARHVWATDITARAALFAEFNCRLAALDNVTVLVGDLYAPVEGLTFDRIVTHPPYVPVEQSRLIFRDGGEDGEQVFRRAVEGLPRFLRPGGHFCSLLMASDRAGESFEQRMRKWMGAEEGEFDILVDAHRIQSPEEFLGFSLLRGVINLQDVPFLVALWKATRTEAIVYATVLIDRHDTSRPAVTRRRQTGEGYTGHHLGCLD